MTIAIIGSGLMGAGLARLLHAKNYPVAIGHRDPAKAQTLAKELGAGVASGGTGAIVKQASHVIFAVPYATVHEALRDAGDLSGKTIIDITNPLSADYKSLTIGHSTSAAEEIQKQAPKAKIVKAFNTTFAALLPLAARAGRAPLQVFVASDDDAAKADVAKIVTATGFECIDAGPLSNARYLEPVAEMAVQFGFFLGWGPAVAPLFVKAQP